MYFKIDAFKKVDNKETIFKALCYKGKTHYYRGSKIIEQYKGLIHNAKWMLGLWFSVLGFAVMNLMVVFKEKSIKSVLSSIIDGSTTFDVMVSVPMDIAMLIITIPVLVVARHKLKHYNKKIDYVIKESDGIISKNMIYI